jgi:hypothetical protein
MVVDLVQVHIMDTHQIMEHPAMVDVEEDQVDIVMVAHEPVELVIKDLMVVEVEVNIIQAVEVELEPLEQAQQVNQMVGLVN